MTVTIEMPDCSSGGVVAVPQFSSSSHDVVVASSVPHASANHVVESKLDRARPRMPADAAAELKSRTPTVTPDKLARVRLKIERAKQHVADLDRMLRAFYDTQPYKIGTKRDPNTRKLIYYVTSVEPAPLPILYLAGDAIQNLRSALDHLAFHLWQHGIYCPGMAEDRVSFRIFGDAADYAAKFHGAVQGSRQDVIDALDAIEPYKGGKGHQLWVLHRLNNIDKHRELLAAGSAAFRSVNLGAFMTSGRMGAEMLKAMRRSAEARAKAMPHLPREEVVLPVLDAYFRPADRMCPLKEGDELFIDAPDAEPNEKMNFRFDVALAEPQVAEGEPLLETIHHIAQLVDQIIVPFGSLL